MLNAIVRYFDLQSARRGGAALHGAKVHRAPLEEGPRTGSGPLCEGKPLAEEAHLSVVPQYIALVLGVAVQPYFEAFRQTGSWAFALNAALGWLLFSVLVSLVIFPSVYRRAFDAGQPRFLQFCAIFAGGMGWKALLDTAVKAAPTVTGG